MPKKTFKDNTAHLDRFFSDTEPDMGIENEQIEQTHETYDAPKTHETYETHDINKPIEKKTNEKYYRFNLKLEPGYKEYLARESWKNHTTITGYINDLIQADITAKSM